MTTAYDPGFDTIKTEVVRGWKITCNHYKTSIHWAVVDITGPRGEDCTIDTDGDFVYEVTEGERGHGYNGDSAQNRTVPAEVVVAAFTMWNTYMNPHRRDGV